MCSITPELFARLLPVHHMIFDYLSQSSPHLIAQLSKYYHRKTLPSLYRVVPVNRKSIEIFDMNSTRLDSPLPFPAHHTEVLRVVNLESALLFANYRVQYAGENIDAHSSPIVPRVKRVEFSWAVFRERFFQKFSGRMGEGGSQEKTLRQELQHKSQLQECLFHIDCSTEISCYELEGIIYYLGGALKLAKPLTHVYPGGALKHAKTSTLVLHVPETGQMALPYAKSFPEPFYTLRLLLWSKAVIKEENAAESMNGVPVPSPNVLDAFAALIGDWAFQGLLDFLDDEATDEAKVMRLCAFFASTYEVCCPNAGHVEQLARRRFKSRHTRAANLELPVRFLELDKETVDEYDLWSMRP